MCYYDLMTTTQTTTYWNDELGLWCWTGTDEPLTQDECDERGLDNRGPR